MVPSRIPSLTLFFCCKKTRAKGLMEPTRSQVPINIFSTFKPFKGWNMLVPSCWVPFQVDMHPELSSPGISAIFQCFYVEVRGLLIICACSNKNHDENSDLEWKNNKKSCKQNKLKFQLAQLPQDGSWTKADLTSVLKYFNVLTCLSPFIHLLGASESARYKRNRQGNLLET